MKMLKRAIAPCLLLATPALGQYFEPSSVEQWAAYFLTVDHPVSCEGHYIHEWAGSESFEPFSASWDRTFRCLDARGSARGGMSSSISETNITCHMAWNGAISAENLIPQGWNNVLTNTWYWLRFDAPARLRVRVQASVHLDYEAFSGPGEEDSATVTMWFGTDSGMGLHIYDTGHGSTHSEEYFDELLILDAGRGELVMYIIQSGLQQYSSVRTGSEYFSARAMFRMDVIPCPGDIDYDNAVGISDLAMLLPNMGGPGDHAAGDLNGDQLVDISDLTEMLSRFGSTCQY